MCGGRYYGGMYDWTCFDGSNGKFMNGNVDKATEKYGPKPTPQQVAEMDKYRGLTCNNPG